MSHSSTTSKQLCRHFVRTGSCKFGTSCRFSHDTSDPENVARTLQVTEEKKWTGKTAICQFFARNGTCRFGDDCRYLHARPDEVLHESASDDTDAPTVFTMFVEMRLERCSTRQAHAFIQCMERCLNADSGGDELTVLRTLGSEIGEEILLNLFGPQKKFVLNQTKTTTTTEVSFLYTFVPFLRLVTSPSILKSTLQKYVNAFLEYLGRAFEWTQIQSMLKELLSMKVPPSLSETDLSASDRNDRSGFRQSDAENKDMWLEVLSPLLLFFLELLRRFDSSFLKDISPLQSHLEAIKDRTLIDFAHPHRKHRKFVKAYTEFSNLFAQKTNRDASGNALAKKLVLLKTSRRVEKRSKVNMYADPPGMLNPKGPRHDNDHSDIEEICIVPTEEEALCSSPPYLPPNKAGSVVHLPAGSVEAHRDLHFRLLRFNLVSDIQTAIANFMESGGIDALRNPDQLKKTVTCGFESRDVSMDIYRHVEVVSMGANRFEGVYYNIEFNEPGLLTRYSSQQKMAFWKRTKRLAHGTLICICWHTGNTQRPHLVFGSIGERNEHKLSSSRPTLGIRSLPRPYNEKLMSLMLKDEDHNHTLKSEVVMLQAGPSFFAFESVLAALKTAPIPLDDIIAQPPPPPSTKGGTNQQVITVPEYAAYGGTFDLGFLFLNKDDLFPWVPTVNLEFPDDFPLEAINEWTTLDKRQAEALKTALTQEIALIQGPPGTGKTYVGVQIVRALLTFKHPDRYRRLENWLCGMGQQEGKSIGPILCICYTNHALDQFLTGLLKAGIRDIIRVGGNSRCKALEQYNLKNIPKRGTGATGYKLLKDRLPGLEETIELRSASLKRSSAKALRWCQVGKFILSYCPRFFDYLDHARMYDGVRKDFSLAWMEWCEMYWEYSDEDWQDACLFPDRPLEELLQIHDFWDISPTEHETLYNYLEAKVRGEANETMEDLIAEYDYYREQYAELKQSSDLECLRSASVVGMTTTYVAMHQDLLASLRPRIVILEEAAEVLEAHVLTSLSADTQQLIMIGDHEQLRPKVDNFLLQVHSGSGFDLDVSMFERLITQSNVHHVTLQSQRRMRPQFSRLIRSTVYPELQDHASVKKYPEAVPGMAKTLFFFDHDHEEDGTADAKSKSNTFEAHFAVHLAAYLLKQDCFRRDDVAIVTPYVGQLLKLRKLTSEVSLHMRIDENDKELLADFTATRDPNVPAEDHIRDDEEDQGEKEKKKVYADKEMQSCVRLATVDNFQGEEAKVVILSLVRNQKEGHIGFVGIKNRINVMLSRAREGMYILGNSKSLEAYRKNTMWKDILSMMREEGCVGTELELKCQNHPEKATKIAHWKDFGRLAAEGGCQELCGQQLPCGHICRRRCHVTNQEHTQSECPVLVSVELPCGHVQHKIPCHKAANPATVLCEESIEVGVEGCQHGHRYQVPCSRAKRFSENPESCTELVSVLMPFCGHKINVPCHREGTISEHPRNCFARCHRQIGGCGHLCQRQCGDCLDQTLKKNPQFILSSSNVHLLEHKKCQSLCGKILFCGHLCKDHCHPDHENCSPCQEKCSIVCEHQKESNHRKCSDKRESCVEPCSWKCEHQGECTLPCGVPCKRLPCDHRCRKQLACGCQCPSLCGEECPSDAFCHVHADPTVKNMEVDMIQFRKYGELTDEDLTQDPLIVLNCGHAFLMSTLDGHMDIKQFYEQDKYEKWTRPVLGERMGMLDNRRVCMICRSPIVSIRRYGRIIKKTEIDLMDRRFVRLFVRTQNKLKSDVEKIDGDLDDLKANMTSGLEVRSTLRKIQRIGKRATSCAAEYRKLLDTSQQMPSIELYRQTLDSIMSKALEEEWSEEELAAELDALTEPKPDQAQTCRACIGFVFCRRLWLQCHRCHIEVLRNHISKSSYISTQRTERIQEIIQRGLQFIRDMDSNIAELIGLAQESLSTRLLTEAHMDSAQVHLECLKFVTEISGMVKTIAMRSDPTLLPESIDKLQRTILQKAEESLSDALAVCSSREERMQITLQQNELRDLKSRLFPLSIEAQIALLKTVVTSDPTMHSGSTRGQLYRCPNGHWYVIGECGQALEQSQCQDCGAMIGGRNYRLTSNNTGITEDEAVQLGL